MARVKVRVKNKSEKPTTRRILFRGRRVTDGEWVYGDVRHDYNDKPRAISDYCGSNPVDPDTVGWFTGLVDKNGKPIFHGDIIRSKNLDPFGNEMTNEMVVDVPNCARMAALSFVHKSVEVIGNIYEKQSEKEKKNDA